MRTDRLVAVVAGGLVAIAVLAALYQYGPRAAWFPECWVHRLTGLSCPGCGMTRATHAALHGRLGEAFRFNPVGLLLLPAALLGVALEVGGWLRGQPLKVRLRPSGRAGWWIFGLLVGFGVLRNIPVWPWTLLAPP